MHRSERGARETAPKLTRFGTSTRLASLSTAVRRWLGQVVEWARPRTAILTILAITAVACVLFQREVARLEGADEAAFVGSVLDSMNLADAPAYASLTDQYGDDPAADRAPAYKALTRVALQLAMHLRQDDAPIRPNPYLRRDDVSGSANKNVLL